MFIFWERLTFEESRFLLSSQIGSTVLVFSTTTANLFVVFHSCVSPFRHTARIGVHAKLNSVGELFAVLPNKRSFHCVLQMPVKELLVIVVISVSQTVTRR